MLVLDGEHPVAQLAFTPDGTRLLVARAQSYPPKSWPFDVLTVATGERLQLAEPGITDWPTIAVHPNGLHAFLAHGNWAYAVRLDDGTGHAIGEPGGSSGSAEGVIASPDGEWVVTANRMSGGPLFHGFRFDATARRVCREEWSVHPQVTGERLAGFFPDGKQFLTAGARRFVVRDTATGAVASEVRYPAESAIRPTLSADGTRLAVRSTSQFYLYDVATWKPRYQLSTEMRPFVRFVYHPTRPLLAVIHDGQTLVKYMDADTGQITAKFGWKLGEMRAVCFSPDGTLCAAGGATGKVVVWDVD